MLNEWKYLKVWTDFNNWDCSFKMWTILYLNDLTLYFCWFYARYFQTCNIYTYIFFFNLNRLPKYFNKHKIIKISLSHRQSDKHQHKTTALVLRTLKMDISTKFTTYLRYLQPQYSLLVDLMREREEIKFLTKT